VDLHREPPKRPARGAQDPAERPDDSHAASHSSEDIEAELRLKALVLDSAVDGLIAHTVDGRPIYFNDTAARQLGYTRHEFAALGPYGWVADSGLAVVPSRLDLLAARGSLLFTSRGAAKDGSTVHTEVHARLVEDGGDEFIVSGIRDVTARVAAQERIRHLAFHDRLTGLANRMKLEDDLRAALSSADRHDDLVGVIYLDLDDFKPVNDELGHAAGDGVLRVVAQRMRECVRECDTVARLGGDEFLVLVTRASIRDDLAVVGCKLAESIDRPIPVEGHHDVSISASLGLAMYEPGEDPEDLINRADHAMYRARQAAVAGWQLFLRGD
jgi:diguanylate cyclase (GGDEF)-like protein/PAS domain S-box-containing protein